MNCPKCGRELNENSKFCPECGYSVSTEEKKEVNVCENCGAENDMGIMFCENCGAPLSTPSQHERYRTNSSRNGKGYNPASGKMKASGILCLISAIIGSIGALCWIGAGVVMIIGSFMYNVDTNGPIRIPLDGTNFLILDNQNEIFVSLLGIGIGLLIAAAIDVIILIFNYRHAGRMFRYAKRDVEEVASFYAGTNPVGFLIANILLGGGILGIIGSALNIASKSSVRNNRYL